MSLALTFHPGDIKTNIIVIHDRDLCKSDAVESNPHSSRNAIVSPHSHSNKHPNFIPPLMLKAVVDVQVTSRNREDAEGDMPQQEEFVRYAADWQYGRWEEDSHSKRADDAPDPVHEFAVFGVGASGELHVQIDDGVQYSLQRGDGSDPAV